MKQYGMYTDTGRVEREKRDVFALFTVTFLRPGTTLDQNRCSAKIC